jgi:thiol-disulfide isomerase/thioredoxin
MRNRIFVLLVCLFVNQAKGQSNIEKLEYPIAGKPMPPFKLKNIEYFSKKLATGDDFRGKWLILDFWSKYCGTCVASFPRMNVIQKDLGDKVQIMLVGIEDRENEIKPMYAKFKEKQRLLMPCDFDSALSNRFDISAVPHLIVIDPGGIVRAVTNHITEEDVKAFLSGEHPLLAKTYYRTHEDNTDDVAFNADQPFLVNGNGGEDSDFIFRSLLSKWTPKQKWFMPARMDIHSIDSLCPKGTFQVLGANVGMLYNYAYYGVSHWTVRDTAYFGKYEAEPILEVKDSSLFKNVSGNWKNTYSYSLIIPPHLGTIDRMRDMMKKDLSEYFGFDAGIQDRECTYWKLISSEAAKIKLRSAGRKEAVATIPHAGLSATNIPISALIYFLEAGHGRDLIISDETGIKDNVDISLDCIMADLQDIRKTLQANGLDLIESKRLMRVLVIRDKE